MTTPDTQAEGLRIATACALAALDSAGDPHRIEHVFRNLAADAVNTGHDPEALVVNVVVGLAAVYVPLGIEADSADVLRDAILADLATHPPA